MEGGDEEEAVGGEDADDAEANHPEADDAEAQDAEADDDHTYTRKSSSTTTSSAKLEPVNKRVDTYMKEHQCVCGYEAPSAQQLLIHNGLLHTNKSYHCWGEWEKRDGTKYRHRYESDDEGQMWRHYRTQHLNIFYHWCPVETCTYGALGGKYGADSADSVCKHMNDYHNISTKLKYPNKGCDYVAPAKYHLERHIKQCSNKDKWVKFYHCANCHKGYRDYDTHSRHVRQKHPEIPGDDSAYYFCEECGKKFSNVSGCNRHAKTHEEPTRRCRHRNERKEEEEENIKRKGERARRRRN